MTRRSAAVFRELTLLAAVFLPAVNGCASVPDEEERRVSTAATLWSNECSDELVFEPANGTAFYYDARLMVPYRVSARVALGGEQIVFDETNAPYVQVWDSTWTHLFHEGWIAQLDPSFAGERFVLEVINSPVVEGATHWLEIERCENVPPIARDFEFKVMTANTAFYAPIPKDNLLEAFQIAASDVDVIIMNEPNRAVDVHGALGLYVTEVEGQGNTGFQILTRWPPSRILHNGVQLNPCRGVELNVVGMHLPPNPYEPYDLANAPWLTAQQLVDSARNSERGRELSKMLESTIEPLLLDHATTIVGGDFNEPSHLDWTERAWNAGLHGAVVPWPVSTELTNRGLIDTYRAILPDEVAWPGNTWTPYPDREGGEIHDRIDFLYHSPELLAIDTRVVGESTETSDIEVWPWPSDHRWVIGTYVASGQRCK